MEPNGGTNTNYYNFLLNINNTYDNYEMNDIPSDSLTVFNGSMDINPNIDNTFDSDWYHFIPNSSGKYYVSLNNAPSDAQYAFFLYNSSLVGMGSFLSSGNESRWVQLEAGQTYYIGVESYDGNYAPQTPYNITKVKAPAAPPIVTADSYNVYVDGKAIDIAWSYQFFSYPASGYFSRKESTTLDINGTSVLRDVYRGKFIGYNKKIENALYIEINYVGFYDYLQKHNTNAPANEFVRIKYHESNELYKEYCGFIYNIDTGRVEDNLGSFPYIWQGVRYSFESYITIGLK